MPLIASVKVYPPSGELVPGHAQIRNVSKDRKEKGIHLQALWTDDLSDQWGQVDVKWYPADYYLYQSLHPPALSSCLSGAVHIAFCQFSPQKNLSNSIRDNTSKPTMELSLQNIFSTVTGLCLLCLTLLLRKLARSHMEDHKHFYSFYTFHFLDYIKDIQ